MPRSSSQSKNTTKQIFLKFATKTIPSLILSLTLFVGGIVLLALRLPGWSLILGLPSIQIGIIFLIFTFDEIARSKISPEALQTIPCSLCGKLILAHPEEEEKICKECRQKIGRGLKKTKKEKG